MRLHALRNSFDYTVSKVYHTNEKRVADYFFGRIVEALKKKGIYNDTLIIFLSDHGDFTGDYDMVEKTVCSLKDVLLRSPCQCAFWSISPRPPM